MEDGAARRVSVRVLGAGREVRKSCVLASCMGDGVLLDCGVQLGGAWSGSRPDVSSLWDGCGPRGLRLVVISHAHMDHCGALPFLTECCGMGVPVVMTHATKALCRQLLLDAVCVRRRCGARPRRATR